MTEPIEHSAEACPACGADRPGLEAFRAAREGRPQPDRGGRHR